MWSFMHSVLFFVTFVLFVCFVSDHGRANRTAWVFFSSSLDTAPHAGPHGAVHRVCRAVAG